MPYASRVKTKHEATLAKAKYLTKNLGNYTRATSYGAAKYVKKVDYDKEAREILTTSFMLDIDKDKIREDETLDNYYMLLTSEISAKQNIRQAL